MPSTRDQRPSRDYRWRDQYKVVSSNPVHGEVYSIQHYVIKLVSNLWQVGGFRWFSNVCFKTIFTALLSILWGSVLLIFSFLSLFTLKDWLLAFHPDKCTDLSVTQKKQPLKHNYILHGHQLQHYVIKLVSNLWQVGGFRWFSPCIPVSCSLKIRWTISVKVDAVISCRVKL
jgi:hypothetical protein